MKTKAIMPLDADVGVAPTIFWLWAKRDDCFSNLQYIATLSSLEPVTKVAERELKVSITID